MLSRNEVWEKIQACVETADLSLFDLDLPSGSNGTLRVYLARKGEHKAGIALDECAQASRRISAEPELDDLLHECQLEVSSPGINRRLRRPEHFSSALGERVKLKARNSKGKVTTVTGVITGCDETSIDFVSDNEEKIHFELSDIESARVDFIF